MTINTAKQYKLSDLVKNLDVTIVGDENCIISGIAPIQKAGVGHITFLSNTLYRKYLKTTQASAVILSAAEAAECDAPKIIASNPYYVYACVAKHFIKPRPRQPYIDKTVSFANNVTIDETATIGARTCIGHNVIIGPNVFIGPNCYIGDDVVIGEGSTIDANVVIHYDVKIGKRTQIASGVVIGGDGFGFARRDNIWHSVPQLGTVLIGDDVRIGENTTVDRGALEDTVIEDGVKLDNLIQVGHNVRIGAHTIIAGCVGIAGSANIGRYCMIGGAACINGHITICDHTLITGMSGITKSIHEPGVYSSGIVGAVPNLEFKKNNARFYRLGELMEKVKQLEKTIQELKADAST